ncbi:MULTISPECIES: HD-GYP domain-containing protein [Bacillaceae]|uniref:HD-GYP domain-containing protein n=1 Tax=Evansella alkalicola TaxID=745819 RepID=A0ABS6JUA2_9BACI|nr:MULTISPECIES: HD-GYP domain-containing protein [Bacillaceae]MBU9722149.1 HD-GYP domain-containing protein [Bacillus alkalicola]
MRLRSIHSLQGNEILAKTIYNEHGQALLNSGVSLSSTMIDRLKDKGISFVYIDDGDTNDILVDDVISDHTRIISIKQIQENFKVISRQNVLGKSVDLDNLSPSFSTIVNNILSDIRGHNEAISMLSDVFCYDSYVFHHSLNVAVYSLAFGKKFGLNEKQLHELGMGAILHDVGKIAIPVSVLNKQEKLTDEEFQLIQEHSKVGFDMLRGAHTISLLTAHCAYQHHERLDGSGYPRGLQGKDIHLYAKIIGIADVFDAVTANRVYRNAKLPHEALEILYAGANTLFDKDMVETFARTIALYPNGLEVELSDGKEGVVSKQNGEMTSRPVIRVLKENGENVEPYDFDLMSELNVTIVSCETSLNQEEAS